jgi:phosphate transport system substrate-binding protein
VEVGEDDQFLINAVTQSANTIGLVGYGQFRMTGDRVKPVSIDGVAPTYANIENGKYPLSRPLFVYVKLSSLQRKPEILGLLQLLVSDDMIGPDGELAKMGLILPSASTTAQNRATLTAKTPIQCPSPFCLDGPAP